ncbi:DUF1579 family protein [Kribbella sp. NPDC050820]|uniref:DUF1579 family protein n=1 Tax=Kribbella sp. NPDC050820 TaxID=3155408 RepID=UPI0033C3AE37
MDTRTDELPRPLQPGPELTALARFHRDVTWTGTIRPGVFGPDSPELTATGQGVHHLIQDGLWIVGDYWQDQFLADGTFVARWQLHWVAGWDPQAQEYRATVVDNNGHAEVLRGRIDGDLLTFESLGRPPVRLRMFWHLTSDTEMIWRNEVSVDGGPFQLVERYVCRTKAPARPN